MDPPVYAHARMAPDAPHPPDELDALTLARAQRGDAAAFRALIERHQRPVHALLWRMAEHALGAARVDDLTQEAFVRVYRHLGRFRPGDGGRLSSWILTIAARLALTELARTRPVTVPIDDTTVELAGPERADAIAERRRLGAAIRRGLAALSPEQRVVVVLADYHELSYDEIASVLAIDLGTVKSRLSRARAGLRAALAEVRHG